MAKRIQKNNVACVEIPLWEISHGPHYDDLQRLLESFWIPDFTSAESLLLQFDLIIVPDPGKCLLLHINTQTYYIIVVVYIF